MNYSLLKSRTFWSIVAMFVIGGTNAITSLLPQGAEPFVMLFLGVLASYFHLDTAKTVGARNISLDV